MANKKIKNATSMTYKDINFKSKLELMAFKVLDEEGFNPQYEPITFTLINGFKPTIKFYKKDKTGQLQLDLKKQISVKYTPDIKLESDSFIVFIEMKGFENDVYYLKKKLFRKFLEDNKFENKESIFTELKTKRELNQFITILKSLTDEEFK